MPQTLLVHPGTQYAFQLAAQLQRIGCLHRFWTGFAWPAGDGFGRLFKLLPRHFQAKLANRLITGVPLAKLKVWPLPELKATRQLREGADTQRVMHARNFRFQQHVPDRDIRASDVVIGFDTSSWVLAARARSFGKAFVLDQSIAHPLSKERVYRNVRMEFPDWSEDLQARDPEVLDAEQAEHRDAHRIVVASSFTKKTLVENDVPEDKIVTIPYGVDLADFTVAPRPDASRPLRFLFVGAIMARKGIPLLLQAWRGLAHSGAQLWLAGPITPQQQRLIPDLPGLRVIGKVAHPQLPALMSQCDVLVFPSYFEGFGLVLLEALASGMPVIATEATAAPDLITSGVEGYIIPSGDMEALVAAMRRFVDSSVDFEKMSLAARECSERYSWNAYGERWLKFLNTFN